MAIQTIDIGNIDWTGIMPNMPIADSDQVGIVTRSAGIFLDKYSVGLSNDGKDKLFRIYTTGAGRGYFTIIAGGNMLGNYRCAIFGMFEDLNVYAKILFKSVSYTTGLVRLYKDDTSFYVFRKFTEQWGRGDIYLRVPNPEYFSYMDVTGKVDVAGLTEINIEE